MIKSIPDILQYFIPGYVFIKTFCFFTSKKQGDTFVLVISSIAVSAIIVALIQLCSFSINTWGFFSIYVLFAFLLAVGFAKLYTIKAANFLTRLINYKSISADIWGNIVDNKLGNTLQVYLKNRDIVYVGELFAYENDERDPWIALSDYVCGTAESRELFYSAVKDTRKTVVVINLRDVDRIELFYKPGTKIIK